MKKNILFVFLILITSVVFSEDDLPSVVILSPKNNSRFINSEKKLSFSGEAFDITEGELVGKQLVWSSDIDGFLSYGKKFEKKLNPGEHIVLLTAITKSGKKKITSVFVIVGKIDLSYKDNPLIISLSEEIKTWNFNSGSAVLSETFQRGLLKIIPHIEDLAFNYQCDVIEIVGHTDQQKISSRASNLDETLITFINNGSEKKLNCVDNAGLGLMRAAAVVKFFKEQKNKKAETLWMIKFFRPLSAGQLILPNGKLALFETQKDEPSRRRIEIRLLRSKED